MPAIVSKTYKTYLIMNEQDKQLLLKVLCAGLNYDIKGRVFAETSNGEFDIMGDMIFNDEPFDVVLDEINVRNGEIRVTALEDEETCDFIDSVQDWGEPYTIETFKPYLRSMDSMTEDEKSEFETLKRMSVTVVMPNGVNRLKPSYVVDLDDDGDGLNNLYDWLNINHFDFRGLIKKGLALEAPKGMYETKIK